jgi:hypothetical protein
MIPLNQYHILRLKTFFTSRVPAAINYSSAAVSLHWAWHHPRSYAFLRGRHDAYRSGLNLVHALKASPSDVANEAQGNKAPFARKVSEQTNFKVGHYTNS